MLPSVWQQEKWPLDDSYTLVPVTSHPASDDILQSMHQPQLQAGLHIRKPLNTIPWINELLKDYNGYEIYTGLRWPWQIARKL
jgi:hypothetical protein